MNELPPTPKQKLSPRELEILNRLAKGETRELISQNLNISKLTYDGYRKNIRMKLNIKNQLDWIELLYSVAKNPH